MLKKWVYSNKESLCIGFFLLFELLIYAPKYPVPEWSDLFYSVTIHHGVSSRYIIGTILHYLVGSVSSMDIYIFNTVAHLISIGFVSFFFGYILKKCDKKYYMPIMLIVVLFLAHSGSVSYFFNSSNYGRFEIYNMQLMFVSIILLQYKKVSWLVPFVGILAVLLHPGFVLLYFFMLLVILLFELVNNNFSKYNIVILVTTFIFVVGTFFWVKFASNIPYNSPEEMLSVIQLNAKQPIICGRNVLYHDFFSSLIGPIKEITIPNLQMMLKHQMIVFLMLSPLYMFFACLLKWCFLNSVTLQEKIITISLILVPFVGLVTFVMVDWGRWLGAMHVSFFTVLLYLIYKQFTPIMKSLDRVTISMKAIPIVYSIMVLFLAVQDKFYSWFSPMVYMLGNIFH